METRGIKSICFVSCIHFRLQSLMFPLATIFQHFLHLVTFVFLLTHQLFHLSLSQSFWNFNGNSFKLSNCNKQAARWQLCQPLASLCCFYFYIKTYFSNKVAVCFLGHLAVENCLLSGQQTMCGPVSNTGQHTHYGG